MKYDFFYHSGFLDHCFHLYSYICNVSADTSSGLKCFLLNSGAHMKPRPLVTFSDSVNHNQVQMLGIPVLLPAVRI